MTNTISFEQYKREMLAGQMFGKMMQDPKIQKELEDIYEFNRANKYELFLCALFYHNHIVMKGQNPRAGFLVGFSQDHLDSIAIQVKSALEAMGREYIIVDAGNKSFHECIKTITGADCRCNHDAYEGMKQVLLNTEKVIVFKEFSKCKMQSQKARILRVRGIIKTNDDAHLDDIRPLSDIIFIDYSDFLQKSWADIKAYISWAMP